MTAAMMRAPPTYAPGPRRSPRTVTPRMEPRAGSILRKTPAREAGTRWMPQFQRRVAAAVQRRPLAATAHQTCQPRPGTGGSPSRRRPPGEEHGRTGEEGPGADGGGRATLGHEPLINEDPTEGNVERGDDEEVAADVSSTDGAVAGAENDKGDAGGGGKEREPAFEVEALVGKDASAHGEDDGHGADHEGGVGDGGEPESLE